MSDTHWDRKRALLLLPPELVAEIAAELLSRLLDKPSGDAGAHGASQVEVGHE